MIRGRPLGNYLQFWREAEQDLLDLAARRTLRSLQWPGRGVTRRRPPGGS
jgi:hypothetical protein